MKNTFFYLILFTFLAEGCGEKKASKPDLIAALIAKYPELSKDSINHFELLRTTILEKQHITFQFYLSEEKGYEGNYIIQLTNPKGKSYAIPLFSNNVRKYWSFENEPKTFKDPYYHSLFEKELIAGINELGLNDTVGTGYRVVGEVLYSVLHCETVTEYDKEKMSDVRQTISNSVEPDDWDDCEKRAALNFEQVLKGITKDGSILNYNAHFDRSSHRIYQYEFPVRRNQRIKRLDMKVYRQECVMHALFL